jgi:hypothetical protein
MNQQFILKNKNPSGLTARGRFLFNLFLQLCNFLEQILDILLVERE